MLLGRRGSPRPPRASLVGSMAVRFRGLFHGVVTLAFAFVARGWLFRQGIFTDDASAIVLGGSPHLFGLRDHDRPRPSTPIGVVVLGLDRSCPSIGAADLGGAGHRGESRQPRARRRPTASPPVRARLTALAIAGFVSGVAGALWAMAAGSLSFTAFDPSMSFVLLAVAIVGGLGTLHGPDPRHHRRVRVALPGVRLPTRSQIRSLHLRRPAAGRRCCSSPAAWRSVPDLLRRRRDRQAPAASEAADDRPAIEPVERPPAAPRRGRGAPPMPIPMPTPRTRSSCGTWPGLRRDPAPSTAPTSTSAPARSWASSARNGAGKSTLLDVISGHRRSDAGTVELVARRRQRARARGPARTSGSAARSRTRRLYPGLTVLETVMVAADRREPSGVRRCRR